MLYRERTAVCSQIHTKHINALCGQNVELLNVKLAVNIVTNGPYSVNISSFCHTSLTINLETSLQQTQFQLTAVRTTNLAY